MKRIMIAGFTVAAAQDPSDLIIRDGTVVDGSGKAGFRNDVGIRNGNLVEVGQLGSVPGKDTIDASGLIIAPGLIDVHTHADEPCPSPDRYLRRP